MSDPTDEREHHRADAGDTDEPAESTGGPRLEAVTPAVADRDGAPESSRDRRLAVASLVTLRTRVAAHGEAAMARTPDAFACRSGCDACCHRRFSVFTVEAERVRLALQGLARHAPDLRERIRRQATDPSAAEHCALLVDGRCTVYEERPIICRSHGLPLGWVSEDDADDSTEGAALSVDVCALNFREHEIPIESVLRLEAVDAPLAVIAELWDGAARVDLATLAAEPDR